MKSHSYDTGRGLRIPRAFIVGGGALFVILVMIVFAHRWRETGAQLGSGLRAAVDAEKCADGRTIEIDWEDLTATVPAGPMVAIATGAGRTIEVDGALSDDAWQDAFDLRVPYAVAHGETLSLLVRCVCNVDSMYLSIWAPSSAAFGPKGARLTLFGDEPSVRAVFECHTNGVTSARRLETDARVPIGPSNWRAAAKAGSEGFNAEYEIPLALLCCGPGDTLHAVLRLYPSDADEPADPDPPLYWLLDSERGSEFDVLLLSTEHRSWPTFRGPNCLVDADGWALSWQRGLLSAVPGERPKLALSLWAAKPAATLDLAVSLRRHPPWGNEGTVWEERRALPIRVSAADRIVDVDVALPQVQECGQYDVMLTLGRTSEPEVSATLPLIVSEDVAGTLRERLIQIRGDVERSQRLTPLHASVLQAHVTRCLAAVGHEATVTWPTLRKLQALFAAREACAVGRAPHAPPGAYPLCCRLPDGTSQWPSIRVPEHYDSQLKWPVLFDTEGRQPFPNLVTIISDRIGAEAPSAISMLCEILSVDPDRIYMRTYCGQSWAAARAIVQRPDLWAALLVIMRMPLWAQWENARHVPMRLHVGTNESDRFYGRAATVLMRTLGCRLVYSEDSDYGHEDFPGSYVRGLCRWLLEHRRLSRPSSVSIVTEGYQSTEAYWASIDGIADENLPARLRVTLSGHQIEVTATNVARYSLDLSQAPVPSAERLTVTENGAPVGHPASVKESPCFVRGAPGSLDESLVKRPGLCGPIGEAIRAPHLLVFGGAADPDHDPKVVEALTDEARRTDGAFGPLEVVPDDQVTENDLSTRHLILLGTYKTNRWLGKINLQLPVRAEQDRIVADKETFGGNAAAYALVYPSPWSANHHVLVISGAESEVVERFGLAFVQHAASLMKHDVVIGEPLGVRGAVRWRLAARFNHQWQWPDPGPVLATLRQPHPQWQWYQCLQEFICEKQGADGLVCGQIVSAAVPDLVGPITARQLAQYLENPWLGRLQIDRVAAQRAIDAMCADSPELRDFMPLHLLAQPSADRSTTCAASDGRIELLVSGNLCQYFEAGEYELPGVFLVEELIRHLQDNPGVDLDALLGRQQKPRGGLKHLPLDELLGTAPQKRPPNSPLQMRLVGTPQS
ncbi:MAG TPA: hypothetical protein VMZ31_05230 [Phycisphaerae bacterium]|nr:hypothetical protein [Phycisphaerae bacterium]